MVATTLNGKDPVKEATVLRACHWVIDAWERDVTAETIARCSLKSQLFGVFYGPEPKPKDWDQEAYDRKEMEDLVQQLGQMGRVKERMDLSTFLNPEEEAIVDSGDDLIQHIASTYTEAEDKDEEDQEQQFVQPVSMEEVLRALDTVLQWEEEKNVPNADFQGKRMREVSSLRFKERLDKAEQRLVTSYFARN